MNQFLSQGGKTKEEILDTNGLLREMLLLIANKLTANA